MNTLIQHSVEVLQGYFSDFHKDYYGYRPRFGAEGDWLNKEWLIAQINQIHDAMDRMKETFEGREELRERGWIIEETDPELAQQAAWLKQERDREYAEWSASLDAAAYGEMV